MSTQPLYFAFRVHLNGDEAALKREIEQEARQQGFGEAFDRGALWLYGQCGSCSATIRVYSELPRSITDEP